jgi:hypothetical protein
MLTTLMFIAAFAGLFLLLFLFLAPVDERDTWLASTRRRVRRERTQVEHHRGQPGSSFREEEERQRIETKLEEERKRSTLQEPD